MNNDELTADIVIDPNQLDVEAVQQSELFYKWAERAAMAKADAEQAEFELDSLEARLQIRCREHPERFNLKSVTEASVKSAVRCSDKYAAAAAVYHKARLTSAKLDKAVAAMEQKKRMIEVLITLHGQQYFAGPSVPRNLGEAWASIQGRRHDRANGRQRTKVRRVVRHD